MPLSVGRPHQVHRIRPRVAAFYRRLAGHGYRPQEVGPKHGPRRPLHIVAVDESRPQDHVLEGRKVLQGDGERFVDPGGIGGDVKLPGKIRVTARGKRSSASRRRNARGGDPQESPPRVAPPESLASPFIVWGRGSVRRNRSGKRPFARFPPAKTLSQSTVRHFGNGRGSETFRRTAGLPPRSS